MAWVRVTVASPEQQERQREHERNRSRTHGRGYGKGYCKLCAGLAHRVPVGERCVKCGLAYQAEGKQS